GRGREQKTFDTVPLESATDYAAEDADVALRLALLLHAQVSTLGLERLYRQVELPMVEVLAELEWNGIRVDADELARQQARLEQEIESLKGRINAAAPRSFNPDSPKQLSEILFNKPDHDRPGLGLKIIKRTKTGASTDVEVLEKLVASPEVESELPAMIVLYRRLTKLVGTYLVALREAIDPDDGRVHAGFHQTVAATGRLSSSDPNLQNIPIRTEVGREVRRAFVAAPGHRLLAADYSQIELRLLAHLSGDEALREAFRRGDDIHRAVAAEVHGVDPSKVTDEQRSTAKMVNFGIVYGITPFGLARRLGGKATVERAKKIIADYNARFRGISSFLHSCIEHARTHGFVATILGRRRPVPQISSRNPAERALGERIAINTVVQGSAADLIKLAMIRIHTMLPAKHPAARMLLQIHDELVFEVPEQEVDDTRSSVVDAMEHAMELAVPIRVETGVGENWFDA
ncbi:MAG: DNA polymerase I, partial [Phycisphaerae bacterium]|nr:DNA polymerase I [Phycisphaerae bacterium]